MKLDPINEMLFDFEELILLYLGRLMTAPMVLIMFWIPFYFVGSSNGTLHRVSLAPEMVAVAICNLRLFPRLAVAISEAIDPTYRVND